MKRAIQLRNIMTSLGPAYIKLGQALSIRPDLLSPAAMNELQKLCDKVRTMYNTMDVNLKHTVPPAAAAHLGRAAKAVNSSSQQSRHKFDGCSGAAPCLEDAGGIGVAT